MSQSEPESPIARNRRERHLAWLLFLIALALAALLWRPGSDGTRDVAAPPTMVGHDG